MQSQQREYYPEKDAAWILGIHPDSMRRLRKQGKITFYSSATGRITYKFDDLVKFVRKTRVEATFLGASDPQAGHDRPLA